MSEDLLMTPIVIQTVDTYRHDYWKISLTLLSELNILTAITAYSYLGNSTDQLNESGYAYVEMDYDCHTFDIAMKFCGREYTLDMEDLQAKYLAECDDDDSYDKDWLSTLDRFDTDIVKVLGYDVSDIPHELSVALKEARDT
jgi:hypothetical protein